MKPAPKSPIKDKIVPTSNIVSNVPSIDLNKASIQEIRWSKETISIEEDESLKQNVQLSPPEASVPSLVKPEVQGSLKELDGWEQDDLTDLVDIAPTVSTSSDVCADEDIPSDGTPSGLNDAQDIPSLAILATEAAWDDFGLEELQSPEVPSIVESPPTVAEESVAHPDFMNLAHKYSEDMKSKREELKLKTFAESHSLDFQTFMEDPSYREAAILQSGETLNRDTILLGSGVAEYYGTLSKVRRFLVCCQS